MKTSSLSNKHLLVYYLIQFLNLEMIQQTISEIHNRSDTILVFDHQLEYYLPLITV